MLGLIVNNVVNRISTDLVDILKLIFFPIFLKFSSDLNLVENSQCECLITIYSILLTTFQVLFFQAYFELVFIDVLDARQISFFLKSQKKLFL